MRTLPRGELAVEPAVSLYTARRALVQHRPRILVFSGHTIGEDGDNVALETPDGAFDMVAAALTLALARALARARTLALTLTLTRSPRPTPTSS
jgi:hypothetical protein